MRQRRRYKNPPIEEAFCELRFEPSQEWDLTIPGKLHIELSDDYPGKPQQQVVVDVELATKEGTPTNLRYGQGLARVQFVTEDGRRVVGVGPDVVSVHMLRPYQAPGQPAQSGWDEFRPRVDKALSAYWQVARPRGVKRIGIRYINNIVVPLETVRIEDYLKCAVQDVEGLPDRVSEFMSRIDYSYEDGVRLVLSQGSINSPSKHAQFLLDLDVIYESSEPLSQSKALEKVNDLRERERKAFEAVITNHAREIFDAD